MSFYPILNAPGCLGWTTLSNFPPNNWETREKSEKFVNVTWCDEAEWKTENIGKLAPNEMRTVLMQDVINIVPNEALALLSLTTFELPARSNNLPQTDTVRTAVPVWRATLGLSSDHAITSYQGEVDPFPPKGSLLTFGPFIQFGEGVENYLILLNVENSPIVRKSVVEIYTSRDIELKGTFDIQNNDATIIDLNGLGFTPNDLPLVICRGMSAIPLYFSKTNDGSYLSLEHTHPPASLVIHGKRWEAQGILKKLWFSKAGA